MSDVPLREYIESQLRAINESTSKTEEQLNKRLEGMNEFREALRDASSRQVTRDECALMRRVIEEKVRTLELTSVRTSLFVSLITAAATGVVVSLITRYLSNL